MWKVPWDPFLIFLNAWTVLLQYVNNNETVHEQWKLYLNSKICLSLNTWKWKKKKKKRKEKGKTWTQDSANAESKPTLNAADKRVWLLMMVCTWESSLLARDVCLMPRTKFGSDAVLNIIISNAMCYTMLYMLEWMRKRKHRIWTCGIC